MKRTVKVKEGELFLDGPQLRLLWRYDTENHEHKENGETRKGERTREGEGEGKGDGKGEGGGG